MGSTNFYLVMKLMSLVTCELLITVLVILNNLLPSVYMEYMEVKILELEDYKYTIIKQNYEFEKR